MVTSEPNTSETTRRRIWLASLLIRRESSVVNRLATHLERLRHAPRSWRRRLRRQLAATLTGAALLLAMSGVYAQANPPVPAATINVFNGEVNIAANGKCSLREAIINANNDSQTHGDCAAGSGADIIELPANGTFLIKNGYATVFYSLTGLPTISSNITVMGNGATIRRDTAAKFRLLAVGPGAHLTLNQATLSNGYATSSGGAIYSYNGVLHLQDSVISGNKADSRGGGIHHYAASSQAPYTSITVDGTTFRANEAFHGGAISNQGDFFDRNAIDINNSLFEGNSAHSVGGAIYSQGADVWIGTSTLASNSGSFGGAISADESYLTVSNSTISDNTASVRGGGIRGDTAGITIVNSTLSGNRASSSGGGIYTSGFELTVINSTLTGNMATLRGGGIHQTLSQLIMERSLVSDNVAPDWPEVYGEALDSATVDKQNIFGHSGNSGVYGFMPGPTDIVPSVGLPAILDSALAENGGPTKTHALVADSPALDAAPKSACNTLPVAGVDQRGLPRNRNGKGGNSSKECDIGAFEAQSVPPAPAKLYVSPATAGMVSGIDARPEDILSFDPLTGTWAKHFDGSDAGLSTALSAFSILPTGDLLLSFKTNATLPGIGQVTPHDVVRFTPPGTFSWYFDGSDVGLTTANERIDAIDELSDDRVLLSTGGAVSVPKQGGGALKAQDEDVLAFTPTATGQDTAGTWALYLDGTSVPGMGKEDVIGAAVDPASGYVYVAFDSAFNVAGVSGDGKDIVVLKPVYGGYKVESIFDGPSSGFDLPLGGIERR